MEVVITPDATTAAQVVAGVIATGLDVAGRPGARAGDRQFTARRLP